MKKLRRSTWILTTVVLFSSGTAIVTIGAAASGPKSTAAKPVPPQTATPAPGAPAIPEESATIRDDPTIAPDPKQSADDNVSFPADI
jgi:hypothetical protein